MADQNIPADMWGALLRIEGTTSRSEAKIDALTNEIRDLKTRVDDHDHRIAPIEAAMAQRKLQVTEFDALKLKVAEIDAWKVSEETTSRNASKWGGAIWGLIGSGVGTGLMFLASLYFQAQPPALKHTTTETISVPARPNG